MLGFHKKMPCIYGFCGLIYSLSGEKWHEIPFLPHKVEISTISTGYPQLAGWTGGSRFYERRKDSWLSV
jgi:hypothetical protein